MTSAQIVLDRTHTDPQEHTLPRRLGSAWNFFFALRRRSAFDRWDAVILCAYTAILCLAIHHYSPFSDEAQEWLIARDSSLGQLLLRRLHYEGHPPLWSLILWVAARLRLPYPGISWMTGALALPGVYLLLRYSPFPRALRWLLPFTFFLQYQYAAVARPYVFVPALLFGIAMIFTADRPRPMLFALLAGLLVNISVHAAIVGAVFFLLYVYQLRKQHPRHASTRLAQSLTPATVIFLSLALCSAAVAVPAPDAVIASKPDKPALPPNRLLQTLLPQERLPSSAPPLDPAYDSRAAVRADPRIEARANAYPWIVRQAVITAILGLSAAFYPIATSNLAAALFLLIFLLWLWARGVPRLFLPFALGIALSVHVFFFDHHTGVFLLALVAAAWIALLQPGSEQLMHLRLKAIQPIVCAFALLLAVLQIGWSWHCIHSEFHTASDPGKETAQFIASAFPDKRVAAFGFESVSAQPYAPRDIFFNWPHAYWIWSANTLIDRRRTETLMQHPDAVVLDDVTDRTGTVLDQILPIVPPGSRPYSQMMEYWQQHGYRESRRFCGQQFRRNSVSYTFCEVIMEPDAKSAGTLPASNGRR